MGCPIGHTLAFAAFDAFLRASETEGPSKHQLHHVTQHRPVKSLLCSGGTLIQDRGSHSVTFYHLNLDPLASPHVQPGPLLRLNARAADFLDHFSIVIKIVPPGNSASGHAGKCFPVSPDPQDHLLGVGPLPFKGSWIETKAKLSKIQQFQRNPPYPPRGFP